MSSDASTSKVVSKPATSEIAKWVQDESNHRTFSIVINHLHEFKADQIQVHFMYDKIGRLRLLMTAKCYAHNAASNLRYLRQIQYAMIVPHGVNERHMRIFLQTKADGSKCLRLFAHKIG